MFRKISELVCRPNFQEQLDKNAGQTPEPHGLHHSQETGVTTSEQEIMWSLPISAPANWMAHALPFFSQIYNIKLTVLKTYLSESKSCIYALKERGS